MALQSDREQQQRTLEKRQQLVLKLEDDLGRMNSVAALCRGEGEVCLERPLSVLPVCDSIPTVVIAQTLADSGGQEDHAPLPQGWKITPEMGRPLIVMVSKLRIFVRNQMVFCHKV